MLHHEREKLGSVDVTPLAVGILPLELYVFHILACLAAIDNVGNELAVVVEIVFELHDNGFLLPVFACLIESVTYILLCNHCYTFLLINHLFCSSRSKFGHRLNNPT